MTAQEQIVAAIDRARDDAVAKLFEIAVANLSGGTSLAAVKARFENGLYIVLQVHAAALELLPDA